MTLPVRLWLDSGAFSIWRARRRSEDIEPITVEAYCEYIRSVEHLLECYISLDEMPVQRGRDELARSARASYENHQRMKAVGLQPMPVFHQGEPLHWLERLIADGETYVGLSGLKGLGSTESVKRWLDVIFTAFTDNDGRALVRFHGLGITAPQLLQRYPLYSVDSTSWTLKGGYGMILVPQLRQDKPDFSKPARIVPISGVNKARRQFERFSELQAAPVLQWLDHIGTDITRVRNLPDERRRAVLHYYEGLRQTLHDVRFTHKLPGYRPPLRVPNGLRALGPWTLTIAHATNTSRSWSVMMTEVGCMSRLLSYAELRECKPGTLEDYVRLRGKFAKCPEYVPPRNWGSAHRSWRAMRLSERVTAYECEEAAE